jgi:hypothetical protein
VKHQSLMMKPLWRVTRSAVLVMALALVGLRCAAAEACNAYLFPESVADVSLASVRADRLPMQLDDEGCPSADSRCAGRAYLVAGNTVLVASAHGIYRCVAYSNGKTQTTGWVVGDGLAPLPAPATTGEWAGRWTRLQGDAAFTIRKRGSAYVASGLATYAVHAGNVRTGTADGTLRMDGAIASLTDDSGDPGSPCRVQFRQFGAWLLVNDGATDDANSSCGGMGVTFNGIYRRLPSASGKTR